MIVRLLLVKTPYNGEDDVPEVLACVDEHTAYENPDWWPAEKARHGPELGACHDPVDPRRLAQTLVHCWSSSRHVQPPPGCLTLNDSAAERRPPGEASTRPRG